MAEKALYGLKTIKIGDVKNETDMPASLTEFKTYRDTFEMTEEEGSFTDEYCDQNDVPIVSFHEKGKRDIKVSTYDYSADFLKKIKGGTSLSNEWKEGDGELIFKALEITTDTGHVIKIPKTQVFARLNLKLKKKELALLEIVFKPLSKISIKEPV
ncbi:hypothetical protein ACQ1P2_03775 [Ornithobacterium rhinotracheale]|uniref:Uncharacterized protein n=1 Tax=Ornithobacterium rhinotracheale (strain ATCC 51463 / DSM 15997 / CCUG 23171 / CIP 104009 / LMG 9086) TaxID=867902 RepID=I4A087_ORNRL|nr:hypothetical protein [Ornithobacterium rhinotracheale]AFL97371.1 hypothetical protein Ornrh_1186 [Ornithobacterium rhinotracheale DSM 15997]MCK0200646.1 hypothetical protein [Ornithobacterium rhinotracheale]